MPRPDPVDSPFIDIAGRRASSDPIHRRLACLHVGDDVLLVARGAWLLVLDREGHPVAAIAGPARDRCRARLDAVRRVTVRAFAERKRSDSHPAYRDKIRVERWRVPLLEIESAPC